MRLLIRARNGAFFTFLATAACSRRTRAYTEPMSANELLEKVKSLPARERRRFLTSIHELEEILSTPAARPRKKPLRWPDAAARRRRIFGDTVLPNLVLLAREEERY